MTRWTAAAAFAAMGISGCYTGIETLPWAPPDGDGPGVQDGSGDDNDGDDAEPSAPESCGAADLGSAPMRRLTALQYANTLDALFDGVIEPSAEFPPPDLSEEGLSHAPEKNIVSLLAAEKIQLAAEDVASQVVEGIDAVAPCAAEADACAESFVVDLARRAFRRPATSDEHALLVSVYDEASSDGYALGIAAIVATVLQMPQFLYLIEEGELVPGEPGLVRLTDHEVAARLSYLLWDGPPDAELDAAADAGELSTRGQIRRQAERLAADERAVPALARFYREWLGTSRLASVDKDPDVFPDYDDQLVSAMQEELERFVAGLHHEDAGLTSLLTQARTEVNAELAAFYGVAEGGDGWWEVDHDPARRSGILTLPAVVAAVSAQRETSSVRRGKLVRTRLLCDEFPPPPPAAESEIEFPDGATERDKWALLEEQAACVGCHRLLNPVGLGLEHYDAIGAWRDVDEAGLPIDASGEVVGIDDGRFEGAPELANLLLEDGAVARCYVERWVQHVAARVSESRDECTIDEVSDAFADADYGLNAAVQALVGSDAFRFRVIEEDS